MLTSEPMHARSHASGAALCGATGALAWSLDPDAVTCPRCRATLLMLGEPLRQRRDGPLLTPICLPAIVLPARPPAPAGESAARRARKRR
jgi:hypothetical protein